MAQTKPWAKVYVEILADPKTRRLTPSERWTLIGFYLLAKQWEDGRLQLSEGQPYTDKDIADQIGVPIATVKSTLQKCLSPALQIMEMHDNIPFIIHYKERQEIFPSWSKDNNKERQRNHRDKVVTRQTNNNNVTTLSQDEGEGEGEGERRGRGRGSATPTPSENFATVWENSVGRPITGTEGQELGLLVDEYSELWVIDSIKEAAKQGRQKVGLKYISRILERWEREGKGTGNQKPKRGPRDLFEVQLG